MTVARTKEIKSFDKIVYIDDMPLIRVQDFNITPNFNTTELVEVGAQGIIESVPDTITSQVTIGTNSIGDVSILKKLLSEKQSSTGLYNLTWNVQTGKYTDPNQGYFTQDDFETASADIVAAVREGTALARSVFVPNCYLTGFDYNYSVDGVGTENYTLVGDEDYDSVSKSKHVMCKIGWYNAALVSGFIVSGWAMTAGSTHSGIIVTQNGFIVATGTQIRMIPSGADTQVSWSGIGAGYGANSTDRFRLFCYSVTPSGWSTLKSNAAVDVPGRGGVFGRQVRIYLTSGNASPTAGVYPSQDIALRVQSVAINADLSREDHKEMGNHQVVGKTLTVPIRINSTFEISEHDLETYARLIGGSVAEAYEAYKNDGSVEAVFKTSQVGTNAKAIIEIFRERSGITTSSTPLKRIILSGLYMTSKNRSTTATARGTVSMGFQCSYISISGMGGTIL